jgi:hypothetical protein
MRARTTAVVVVLGKWEKTVVVLVREHNGYGRGSRGMVREKVVVVMRRLENAIKDGMNSSCVAFGIFGSVSRCRIRGWRWFSGEHNHGRGFVGMERQQWSL